MPLPAEGPIQLSAYLDDELDRAEAGKVEALLTAHPELLETYLLIKQVCETLTNWDRLDCTDVAASPSFEKNLSKRLECVRCEERCALNPSFSLAIQSRN